jgi:hypothetical protein
MSLLITSASSSLEDRLSSLPMGCSVVLDGNAFALFVLDAGYFLPTHRNMILFKEPKLWKSNSDDGLVDLQSTSPSAPRSTSLHGSVADNDGEGRAREAVLVDVLVHSRSSQETTTVATATT